MINLETKYLGLTLKNPIIISSSGLTSSITKIKEAEKAGAAAIVLKSVFEEQINQEADSLHRTGADNPEAFDYLQAYVTANNIENYLNLIKEAKKAVSIPVIASINCFSNNKWTDFAQKFAQAGADALELNIYILPVDRKIDSTGYEKMYFNIIESVVKKSPIPVSVKISHHFTNLVNIVDRAKAVGAKGVVMFNRMYQPDIDIDKLEITAGNIFSSESDLRFSLRWAAIISDAVKGIDIAASTGVHSAKSAIKMLLAGAAAVQICSVIYNNGWGDINKIISGIELWMREHKYSKISDFKGILSYNSIPYPEVYQRSQFMKYFSNFD